MKCQQNLGGIQLIQHYEKSTHFPRKNGGIGRQECSGSSKKGFERLRFVDFSVS